MSNPSFETLANSTQTFVNVSRDRLIAATKGRKEPQAKLLHDAAVASDCKLVQIRPRVLLAALPFFNPEPAPTPAPPPQTATVDKTQSDRTQQVPAAVTSGPAGNQSAASSHTTDLATPVPAAGSTTVASDAAIVNDGSSVTSDAAAADAPGAVTDLA